MPVSIFAILFLSVLTPLLIQHLRKAYGIVLAVLTLPILIYFILLFDRVREGAIVQVFRAFHAPGFSFSFYLDGLSLLFAITVLGIGLLVLLYSNSYMQHHGGKGRFYSFMLLFMGSMLGLVLAGNLISLYIFWSLTGISSFLLIGFYHREGGSRKAALQSLIVTEAGGLAMLAGIILLGTAAGSYEIKELLTEPFVLAGHKWYKPALFLLLSGAFTKSAQFPFHFWLPSAMKAPTPVSAYLHSAAMVNGGIYLLARLAPVMSPDPLWNYSLIATGLATLFLGVYLAVDKRDIKAILAYTTIGSLGMMVFLLGVGTTVAVKAALLYLVIHALFKSALFMVAGIVDEKTGVRDIYATPRLWKPMTLTAIAAMLALISMGGLPPVLGFIGKELIYEAALTSAAAGSGIVVVALLSNALMFFISAILAYQLFFAGGGPLPPGYRKPGAVFIIGPAVPAALGLILALVPGKFESLMGHSVTSAGGAHAEMDIELWHGLTKELLLSGVTVIAGVLLFAFRKPVIGLAGKINSFAGRDRLDSWFFKAGKGLVSAARAMTALIQHGYQRIYLMVIFLVSGLFFWYLVIDSGANAIRWDPSSFSVYATGIAFLTCLAAITAAVKEDKLSAIITMGVAGYGVASIYFLYGAIDLAITQFLIETLILVVFVMVVYRLPQFERFSRSRTRIRDAVVAAISGGSITGMILLTRATGHPDSRVSEVLSSRSYTEAHGRNIVDVILVDFRALDTLGEITVVILAALGTYSLLQYGLKKGRS